MIWLQKYWKSSVLQSQKKPNHCFKVSCSIRTRKTAILEEKAEPPPKPEREVENEQTVEKAEIENSEKLASTDEKIDTTVKVDNGQVKTELQKEELPDSKPDPKPRKRHKFCRCC